MFKDASDKVKKQLLRLMFLYDEIDYLKDEYCARDICPEDIECTIQVLVKQIESIRDAFFLDKTDE